MQNCKIANLYDLDETIAKELFQGHIYPWEVLSEISKFIVQLGNTLDTSLFEKHGEDIWIAKKVQR